MSSNTPLKDWQRYKLEKGQWIGVYPYGYRVVVAERFGKYNEPGEVFLVDEEKEVVADIFLRYSQGNIALKSIKKYIEDKHKVSLHLATIHRILMNQFYKGIMVWKGESFPHHYPLITTPEIFDLCQTVRKNNYRDGLYVPSTDSFKKNPSRLNKKYRIKKLTGN